MPRTVAPLSLSWPQVVGRRLARHHLLAAAPAEELVGVAGDICGVHCQMGVSAELMLGARVAGITRSDVREALGERRTLVKTVGGRGTGPSLPRPRAGRSDHVRSIGRLGRLAGGGPVRIRSVRPPPLPPRVRSLDHRRVPALVLARARAREAPVRGAWTGAGRGGR